MSSASSSQHLEYLPFPVLIGDIGGTNARFALISDMHADMRRLPVVHTADFETIDDAIQASVLDRTSDMPRSAVMALAGPIAGEKVRLTNCDWVVEPRRIVERFGLSEMVLLNDFEAQSLALPNLGPEDIDRLGGGTMRPEATRVVIGPGTGLGAGALVHARSSWVPVPGEGGHIDLGPQTDRDIAIWPHIERGGETKHGNRVAAESLLSGGGMLRLYRAISAADGAKAELSTPEDVTNAGLAGTDPRAVETLNLFATYLGRVAGDFALIFMAYGGVFLGGGIAPKIAPALKGGAFREAFLDKAPHGALMARMATAIITEPQAALIGIAAFARTPMLYGVDLAGRRWQG